MRSFEETDKPRHKVIRLAHLGREPGIFRQIDDRHIYFSAADHLTIWQSVCPEGLR